MAAVPFLDPQVVWRGIPWPNYCKSTAFAPARCMLVARENLTQVPHSAVQTMAVQFTAEAVGLVRENWTLITTPGVNTGDGDATNDGDTQQVIEMHGLGVVEDFRVAPAREEVAAALESQVVAQKIEDLIRDLVVARVATPPPQEGTDPTLMAAHQQEFEERNLGYFYSPPTFAEVRIAQREGCFSACDYRSSDSALQRSHLRKTGRRTLSIVAPGRRGRRRRRRLGHPPLHAR